MGQTIKVDMATQVDAWKKGVDDGQLYMTDHGKGMDNAALDQHAEAVCQETDTQKRRDWKTGYCRGFREGVRRGLQGPATDAPEATE